MSKKNIFPVNITSKLTSIFEKALYEIFKNKRSSNQNSMYVFFYTVNHVLYLLYTKPNPVSRNRLSMNSSQKVLKIVSLEESVASDTFVNSHVSSPSRRGRFVQ